MWQSATSERSPWTTRGAGPRHVMSGRMPVVRTVGILPWRQAVRPVAHESVVPHGRHRAVTALQWLPLVSTARWEPETGANATSRLQTQHDVARIFDPCPYRRLLSRAREDSGCCP